MLKYKSSFLESFLSFVRTRSTADSTVFVAFFNLFPFSTIFYLANIKGTGTSKLLSINIIVLIIFPEDCKQFYFACEVTKLHV